MTRTIDRDRGYSRIRAQLKQAHNIRVTAGWQPDAKHPNFAGPTAELAAIHEYGGGHVPARPMLRPVFDKNRERYRRLQRELWDDVFTGKKNINEALKELGEVMVEDIKDHIMTGPHLPLAPSTVARKGHDQPLIETKTMHDQVSSKVERGRRR